MCRTAGVSEDAGACGTPTTDTSRCELIPLIRPASPMVFQQHVFRSRSGPMEVHLAMSGACADIHMSDFETTSTADMNQWNDSASERRCDLCPTRAGHLRPTRAPPRPQRGAWRGIADTSGPPLTDRNASRNNCPNTNRATNVHNAWPHDKMPICLHCTRLQAAHRPSREGRPLFIRGYVPLRNAPCHFDLHPSHPLQLGGCPMPGATCPSDARTRT